MAGRIPQDFIDDLIARADIVEVIGRRVQLKKAGREFKACCPFHDEKTPSFTVSPGKGFYHCFGCGMHGTAIGFLMEYDHMSFVEAIESLASTMGVDVPRDESDRPARRYDELFSLMSSVDKHWQAEPTLSGVISSASTCCRPPAPPYSEYNVVSLTFAASVTA